MKKTERFIIEIDLENEFQAYKIEEPDVSTEEAVLRHVDNGELLTKITRHMLIARELNQAAPGILRPAKTELIAGANMDIQGFVSRQTVNMKIGDHTVKVRQYKAESTGRPPLLPENKEDEVEDELQPSRYLRTDTAEAAEAAMRQMDRSVIGNIRNQLAIVRYALGKDEMVRYWDRWLVMVRAVAQEMAENGD